MMASCYRGSSSSNFLQKAPKRFGDNILPMLIILIVILTIARACNGYQNRIQQDSTLSVPHFK